MLAEPAPYGSNVAHTDNLSLIALSRSSDVGVDIDASGRLPCGSKSPNACSTTRSAPRFVSRLRRIRSRDALLVQWCRLEAELKAMGSAWLAPYAVRIARNRNAVCRRPQRATTAGG
jgi:phosphopantetheinyl transferase